MKEYLPIIRGSALFAGVTAEEAASMLTCLGAVLRHYDKGVCVLRAGVHPETLGLVLAGRVLLVQEDVWGNRNILSAAGPGESFAESFACAADAVLNVNVVAEADADVLLLDVHRILATCPTACAHHSRIIRNLLSELAGKNLRLNEKVTHLSQRTTRERLLSYLSAEARRHGTMTFDIGFNRQELADFLSVDRSGLSTELGKLRDEGILSFNGRHFVLS